MHCRFSYIHIYIYIYIYIYIAVILDNRPISPWTNGQHSLESTSDAWRVIQEAGHQECIKKTSRPWLLLWVTTSRVSSTWRRLGGSTCEGRAREFVKRVGVWANTCVGLKGNEVDVRQHVTFTNCPRANRIERYIDDVDRRRVFFCKNLNEVLRRQSTTPECNPCLSLTGTPSSARHLYLTGPTSSLRPAALSLKTYVTIYSSPKDVLDCVQQFTTRLAIYILPRTILNIKVIHISTMNIL